MLRIKRVSERKDLELIEQLAEVPDFQITVENRELLQRNIPCFNYLILNEKDEAVGFRVMILHAPNCLNKYQAYLTAAYQNRGLFNSLENQIELDLIKAGWDGKSVFYDANNLSLHIFRAFTGMTVGPKLNGYRGEVRPGQLETFAFPKPQTGLLFRKVDTQTDLDLLKAYDNRIIPINREAYLKEFFGTKAAEAWIAIENGACVGYLGFATISETSIYTIPLYADTENTALTLLKTALENQLRRRGREFTCGLNLHLEKTEMHRLVKHFGWDHWEECEIRISSGHVWTISWEKVYGIHEVFLV